MITNYAKQNVIPVFKDDCINFITFSYMMKFCTCKSFSVLEHISIVYDITDKLDAILSLGKFVP